MLWAGRDWGLCRWYGVTRTLLPAVWAVWCWSCQRSSCWLDPAWFGSLLLLPPAVTGVLVFLQHVFHSNVELRSDQLCACLCSQPLSFKEGRSFMTSPAQCCQLSDFSFLLAFLCMYETGASPPALQSVMVTALCSLPALSHLTLICLMDSDNLLLSIA